MICGSAAFKQKDKTVCFTVFNDQKIGIKEEILPTVPMVTDEDCETTSSVKRYGTNLCIKDLQEGLKIPREQSEQESSYVSYEDQ